MTEARPRRVKVDMHMHSEVSPDSRLKPAVQARRIRQTGIDVACVTDHNSIRGAQRLRELADGFRVVVGSEILSRDGEIIGLFLEKDVPPRLSAEETIARIREQGGLVVIPHPFSRNRLRHIRHEALDRVRSQIDAIEVFNARESFTSDNVRAAEYARQHGLVGAVASDSHRSAEIGKAWIEMDDFDTALGFLGALRDGTANGSMSGQIVHLWTRYDVMRKWIARRLGRG
jgi:predicted metal-dependent phosphoesterase TrpH